MQVAPQFYPWADPVLGFGIHREGPDMFCPQAVVWGDAASWVSAVAAVAGVVGIWLAFVEFKQRRIDREEVLRAQMHALGTEVFHVLSVMEGIIEAFRGIPSLVGLGPWLNHEAHVVLNLRTQRLESANDIPGIPAEIAALCPLALNAVRRAQQLVQTAQQNPHQFRMETTLQEAAASSREPVLRCAEEIWRRIYPGQTPPWQN